MGNKATDKNSRENPATRPEQGSTIAPHAIVDVPSESSPDVFGHEGFESNIKPNTSGKGERQDRS